MPDDRIIFDGDAKAFARYLLYARRVGAKGGIKVASGGASSARKEWEPIAKRMIMEIREKHPDFSQDKIAVATALSWKPEDPKAPGHRSLKNLIAAMEKAGEIPRRASVRRA